MSRPAKGSAFIGWKEMVSFCSGGTLCQSKRLFSLWPLWARAKRARDSYSLHNFFVWLIWLFCYNIWSIHPKYSFCRSVTLDTIEKKVWPTKRREGQKAGIWILWCHGLPVVLSQDRDEYLRPHQKSTRSLSGYRVERSFWEYWNPWPRHDLAFGQVLAHCVQPYFF